MRIHNRLNHSIILLFLIYLTDVAADSAHQRVWVFFKDKSAVPTSLHKSLKPDAARLNITQKAMQRRTKNADETGIIDDCDLPVSEQYLETLRAIGCQIYVRSRWLNGVSMDAPSDVIEAVRKLDFVKAIQTVGYSNSQPVPMESLQKSALQQPGDYLLDYGYSFTQVNQIRVPEVHELNINGSGVLVGMLDSGFEHELHEALRNVNVVAEHDFYWDDDTTSNQVNDSSVQHNHGTQTLSTIGGYYPGRLIGPAYGADYALAKTEWIPEETRIEEDYWVAGIEWLERQGADVVSSSVGYNFFDGGFSYTYQDLNGETCITTRAAEIAFKKGVVVVNSAGNERRNSWEYINSPADGPNVIAAGAVDMNGELAYFSSKGPTSDGRIKPDVMAMGLGCYTARPSSDDPSRYVYVNGTSFACPLTAGVCALILQAHPELTASQVREALLMTADRADSPDNDFGYGLIDAYKAVFYHGPVLQDFSMIYNANQAVSGFYFSVIYNESLIPDSVAVFVSGSLNDIFQSVPVLRYVNGENVQFQAELVQPVLSNAFRYFYITLYDATGKSHQLPVNGCYQIPNTGDGGSPLVVQMADACELRQNYPNPFNQSTTIPFIISSPAITELSVFNLLGQCVDQLARKMHGAGEYRYQWSGTDRNGNPLPTGVYFAVLQVGKWRTSCKMLIVR